MKREFVDYTEALALKELGFDEPCLAIYYSKDKSFSWHHHKDHTNDEPALESGEFNISAPLYQQAINFLYICSNKQIDIELKGSDTYEERIRKIEQGCKDLWNLQNNKSN